MGEQAKEGRRPAEEAGSAPPDRRSVGTATPYVTLAVLALVVWAVAVVWSLRIVLEESPAAEGGAGPQANGVRIDLNRASAEELQALSGIGPVLSARIVQERAKSGGFSGVDDLLRVRGITKELIGRLRPFLSVVGPAGGRDTMQTDWTGSER